MTLANRPAFDDDKARVLEATDIVRLISQHVALKRGGKEYKCVCPFHDDHNPSMYVVPMKQIYHCFVCGAGGNAFRFVMDYHKMSFREALQYLADKAGITLTPRRREFSGGEGTGVEGGEGTPGVSREQLAGANKAALEFYRAILVHPEHGKAAREVLEKRGVSAEMIQRFQIGAAPDRWDGLAMTIAHKKLDALPFLSAGLIKNRTSGEGAFDMQRNRVIFPIFDLLDRPIAFGGRRINDADEPKYINSAESSLFNKSSTLYALNLAAESIRKTKQAIVVEGYMDAIACHQAGVTNVVATLGTALTAIGARVLARMCDQVVLLFDGDDAGQRAADRAVEVFFNSTLEVRIATLAGARAKGLTRAKDPDELVKSPGGVEILRGVFADATDALDYRFTRMRDRLAGMTMTQRATAINEELQRLTDLGLADMNPVRRQMVIKRIAELSGVGEEPIRRSLVEIKPNRFAAQRTAPGSEPAPVRVESLGTRSLAEHALELIVAEPSLWQGLTAAQRELLSPAAFASPAAKAVASVLSEIGESKDVAALSRELNSIEDAEAGALVSGMVVRVQRLYGENHARLLADFAEIMTKAYQRHLKDLALKVGGAAGAAMMQRAHRADLLNTAPAPQPGSLARGASLDPSAPPNRLSTGP